ncbi:UNVERIFIED_CONTAM: hypothetical protein PYX00_005338 [Menopon gallinae]|uniref:LRRCT domain-containing protein n=1 Tax=Menopon gallinae TaxID=328185 RepID=A0AAW2HSG8_9NEOP
MSVFLFMWGAAFLLLTEVTSQQVTQHCPSHGEILPCKCTVKKNGLDILCEYTEPIHITKALAALKGKPSSMVIFYLKLRHNVMPKLQSFVFLGLEVSHLTIHNCSLAVVEETSLSSIGNELTQLDLSSNNLATVPSKALKNLHHLLILNLNHNKLSVLHNRAFEGLDTLEVLTIYENKISTIEPDAFRGLEKKLKRLNLGGNELTAIPTQALMYMENLKKLEIQENKISEITEDDFKGLEGLDGLILAHNRIKEIPSQVFRHLSSLTTLELEGNAISRLDPEAFMGLEENLQYLRLGDNNLPAIPSETLKRLHRLRTLDLRANNISYVLEDAFTGYGDSITFLNLQKNMIKTLPALAFENLNSLETLNLQNNKLKHIPEEIMDPVVDTLRIVDISDNPLICDCELQWYKNWLTSLRGKEDEAMHKKRVVCLMASEHREYGIQNLPLDKMNCVGKNMGRTYNVACNNHNNGFKSVLITCLTALLISCTI